MSPDVSTATNTTRHSEHLADRAAMLALQPKADLGPAGHAAFDELIEKTPSAEGVAYEAATVGGVPGWWCRPAAAEVGAGILYLHGGAYVVESARAYRHFAGQIASRANAPAFVTDYGLAPERPFPAAVEDAEAAYLNLAGQASAQDPRVPPLYGDLADLPTVLLYVGEDEILLDDARRYANRSSKFGSEAKLHIWQGMAHVFPANLALLEAAREALDIAGEFLHRNLARRTKFRETRINPN
jgi:acetyl esterase/lipase